jgi:hypothetical protein
MSTFLLGVSRPPEILMPAPCGRAAGPAAIALATIIECDGSGAKIMRKVILIVFVVLSAGGCGIAVQRLLSAISSSDAAEQQLHHEPRAVRSPETLDAVLDQRATEVAVDTLSIGRIEGCHIDGPNRPAIRGAKRAPVAIVLT